MASHKSNLNTIIWIIGIIAVLAFLGVVYLIIKDLSSSGTILALSGKALSNPDSRGGVNPLTYCSAGDHRACSATYDSACKRDYGGNYGSYCTNHEGNSVTCECIANVV